MVKLTLQKRLAADILKCGKRRVIFNSEHEKYITQANTRAGIRHLINSKVIFKRAENAASRGRFRVHQAAVRLGRHSGMGSRRGTAEARMPSKSIWVRRHRILRRMIQRYRDANRIDCHLYQKLYCSIKGNQFKNKRVLLDYIINMKNEQRIAMNNKAEIAARQEKAAAIRAKRYAAIESNRIKFAKGN